MLALTTPAAAAGRHLCVADPPGLTQAPQSLPPLKPSTRLPAGADASLMYHAHWGLARSPFAGEGAPLFYQGESQAEALARLRYVAQHRRHALLAGPRGVGKSLLLRHFADRERRDGRQIVHVDLAGLSPRELLWQIAAGLAIAPRPDDDAIKLFQRLGDHSAMAPWRKASRLLLLDDADQAGPDARACLLRLTRLGGDWPWLTLVMTVNQGGASRLGEQLLDATELRIDLDPWSEIDTVGYIQHALVEAGADRPLFEDEALAALYALTDGVPRLVNRLADHALLGAAANGADAIDAAMMESAHDALNWTAAGPA